MDASDPEVEGDPSGLVARLRSLLHRSGTEDKADFRSRMFGSPAFFRLWLAQAVASLGDWLGFLAILALASRIGLESGQQGTSIGIVMAARIIPGLFFSGPAGVLIDRMDRKQVMVVTTIVRAGVVATLPFVDSVLGLVFASFVLELASLLFQPAKDAAVPNLVPADRLASANSLGLAAAYGTFPVASLLFALLAKVAAWLGGIELFDSLKTSQEAVAFYAQGLCYVGAAVLIARLAIPRDHVRLHEDEAVDLGAVFTDIKEGWHYAFLNPVVRAVNIGLGVGLIGGGMLVPLGEVFSRRVLDAGTEGFGVITSCLGVGVAAGVIGVSARHSRIRKERTFVLSLFAAGVALMVAASISSLALVVPAVIAMGVFAGAAYVLGYTLLQSAADDELRGRVLAGTYMLVRVCLLFSMAIGPFLLDLLDGLSDQLFGSDRTLELVGIDMALPGVRLTLWVASLLMVGAAGLAGWSLRSAFARRSTAEAQHPSGTASEPEPQQPHEVRAT
jgi:dTMP kinase